MKASNIIISVLFALQVTFLFAANAGEPVNTGSINSTILKISLAPTTPAVATFEDVPTTTSELNYLAPTTPAEAYFNDEVPVVTDSLKELAPVTPAEADFNDTVDPSPSIISLAPATPAEADFD